MPCFHCQRCDVLRVREGGFVVLLVEDCGVFSSFFSIISSYANMVPLLPKKFLQIVDLAFQYFLCTYLQILTTVLSS